MGNTSYGVSIMSFCLAILPSSPPVSHADIFNTRLWAKFSIFTVEGSSQSNWPCFEFYVVESETGRCDEEVESTLKKCLRPRDIASVDLTKTVVICSKLKRKEVDEINGECLQRIDGELKCYTALDSDNNGKQLREADEQRLRRISTRLPDELSLKEGCRVVLRRNLDISQGWVNGIMCVEVFILLSF